MADLSDFFTHELMKLPPDRGLLFKNGSAWIRCPFHSGGNESTPSFTINLDSQKRVGLGYCGCFGCSVKFPWNGLAELFKLKQVTEGAVREAAASGVFRPPSDDDTRVPDLEKMLRWPTRSTWRTIPGELVRQYDGRTVWFKGELAVYFPVLIYGEQVGGITALVEKPTEPGESAYINSFGTWSRNSLFGFDQAAERTDDPLWVAEGPRSMLKLVEHGARAVSLIGSRVTTAKLNLIAELDPPLVVVATDPDPAGDGAYDKLHEALSRVGIKNVRAEMPKGTDPANLSKGQVTRFLRRLRQERLC